MNVSVNINMVTTAFELPGYRVVKNLGLVRGVTVRSRRSSGRLALRLRLWWAGILHCLKRCARRPGKRRWS